VGSPEGGGSVTGGSVGSPEGGGSVTGGSVGSPGGAVSAAAGTKSTWPTHNIVEFILFITCRASMLALNFLLTMYSVSPLWTT